MAQQTKNQVSDEKQRALSLAFAHIEKQYGKGAIMRLGESHALDIPVISSGSLALDAALGVGGLPRGRIIEIFGPESSGKTTLALHAIASAQRSGGEAAFVDAEHALDPVYARQLGVNCDELLIAQPDSGEQALEITDVLEHIVDGDAVQAISLGGFRMHAMAILTFVDAGDIGGDQLPFAFGEWRRAAQHRLV